IVKIVLIALQRILGRNADRRWRVGDVPRNDGHSVTVHEAGYHPATAESEAAFAGYPRGVDVRPGQSVILKAVVLLRVDTFNDIVSRLEDGSVLIARIENVGWTELVVHPEGDVRDRITLSDVRDVSIRVVNGVVRLHVGITIHDAFDERGAGRGVGELRIDLRRAKSRRQQ